MARSVALTAEHRQAFFSAGHLHLEGIVSLEQCGPLYTELFRAWRNRCHQSGPHATFGPTWAGRDLWRSCPAFQRAIRFAPLGELLAQMWTRTPLRVLYDQLLTPVANSLIRFPYREFTLEGASCFSHVAGGVVLCLGFDAQSSTRLAITVPQRLTVNTPRREYIQFRSGSGVFIEHDTQVDIEGEQLQRGEDPGQILIFIAAGTLNARYRENDTDPGRGTLFNMGYTIGDALREDTHPSLHSHT